VIEIRIDEFAEPAHPDGPQNHEQTRVIASGIHEAFRLLNYATMHSNGLRYPSDVYSVLGTLSSAVALLPQALEQMRRWVAAEVAGGHARENAHYGPCNGDAERAAAALTSTMQEATRAASRLASLLAEGRASMRGMESTRDTCDKQQGGGNK
jgi:hypothetical protein